MRGVPRARRAISRGAFVFELDLRAGVRSAARCVARSACAVELQPRDDAEAVAQRVGQHAGARGGADQRERRQVELDRARRRPLADHDVDLEVLERRVQDLLDHRREAVDLVDEQHVLRLEVGQQRGEVAGALEHRARGLAQVDAELPGDDVRERGLAQARRAEQQHVVERLAAAARRLDEDLELAAHLLLADVLGERAGPQRALELLLLRRDGPRGDHAIGFYAHSLILPDRQNRLRTGIPPRSRASRPSASRCSPIRRAAPSSW